MTTQFRICLFSLVFATSFTICASAETKWSNWRGPSGNGVASGNSFPVEWSEEKGVLWKLELAGRGASTPIIVDDQIVFTLTVDGKNSVWAIDLMGNKIWEKNLGSGLEGKSPKASGANSSPVTDGERIYVYFKNGEFACLSLKGDISWSVNLQNIYGEDTLWWDLGTSPILSEDLVIVAIMHSGPSFLVALDKKSGVEVWKADRWLNVNQESNQSYTTPTVTGNTIVTVGADHVTGHRVSDGKALWKIGGLNPDNDPFFRSIASPVIVGNLAICPYARGKTITAVRTDSEVEESKRIAWTVNVGSDVPTPIAWNGKVYNLSDRGLVICLNSEDGKTVWQEQLPKSNKPYSSSPILGGNNLYCTREDGMTFVLDISGDNPKILAENRLEGQTVATPVLVDGRIYIRTYEALYCIGDN